MPTQKYPYQYLRQKRKTGRHIHNMLKKKTLAGKTLLKNTGLCACCIGNGCPVCEWERPHQREYFNSLERQAYPSQEEKDWKYESTREYQYD